VLLVAIAGLCIFCVRLKQRTKAAESSRGAQVTHQSPVPISQLHEDPLTELATERMSSYIGKVPHYSSQPSSPTNSPSRSPPSHSPTQSPPYLGSAGMPSYPGQQIHPVAQQYVVPQQYQQPGYFVGQPNYYQPPQQYPMPQQHQQMVYYPMPQQYHLPPQEVSAERSPSVPQASFEDQAYAHPHPTSSTGSTSPGQVIHRREVGSTRPLDKRTELGIKGGEERRPPPSRDSAGGNRRPNDF